VHTALHDHELFRATEGQLPYVITH